MDVGSRIRFFREKRNISVNKLAYLSGVSQSYLRDIELGKKQPTVDYLEYICYGLNISLKEFFDVENTNSNIISALQRLDENQKKLLLEFINSL